MVVRNIAREIICEHKDECKFYNCTSNKSICPTCKNNIYVSPMESKKDYYEPKSRIPDIIFCVIVVAFLAILLL